MFISHINMYVLQMYSSKGILQRQYNLLSVKNEVIIFIKNISILKLKLFSLPLYQADPKNIAAYQQKVDIHRQ